MENGKPIFDCEKFLRRTGLGRDELARRLGFKNKSTIGNWCTGTSTPNYSTIVGLIENGITAEELFGPEAGMLLLRNSSVPEADPSVYETQEFRDAVAKALEDSKAVKALSVMKERGII